MKIQLTNMGQKIGQALGAGTAAVFGGGFLAISLLLLIKLAIWIWTGQW